MTHEKKGHMLRNILIGSLVGAVVSLFNKSTRENAKQQASKMKTSSAGFVNTLREDPSQLTNNVRELSSNVRILVNDINEDVRDMMVKVDEIKKNSTRTVQSARQAGDELREIGDKIKHAGDQKNESEEAADNTDVHQQL